MSKKKGTSVVEEIMKASISVGYPITSLDQVDEFCAVLLAIGKVDEADMLLNWRERMLFHKKAEWDLNIRGSEDE